MSRLRRSIQAILKTLNIRLAQERQRPHRRAGEARDAVILVHHRRAGTQIGEGGDRTRPRAVGATPLAAAQQSVLQAQANLDILVRQKLTKSFDVNAPTGQMSV